MHLALVTFIIFSYSVYFLYFYALNHQRWKFDEKYCLFDCPKQITKITKWLNVSASLEEQSSYSKLTANSFIQWSTLQSLFTMHNTGDTYNMYNPWTSLIFDTHWYNVSHGSHFFEIKGHPRSIILWHWRHHQISIIRT